MTTPTPTSTPADPAGTPDPEHPIYIRGYGIARNGRIIHTFPTARTAWAAHDHYILGGISQQDPEYQHRSRTTHPNGETSNVYDVVEVYTIATPLTRTVETTE